MRFFSPWIMIICMGLGSSGCGGKATDNTQVPKTNESQATAPNDNTSLQAFSAKDFQKRLDEIFQPYFEQMSKTENLFAEKGDERIQIVQYKTKKISGFPIEKATFFVLENGWVWNKDDKTLLDENEIIAGAIVPSDDCPLPFVAVEASLHIDKYDHLNIDLFPLSKDAKYKKLFSEPLQKLREQAFHLPGFFKKTVNPDLLGGYTSGGMFGGDFPVALRDQTIPLWFEYATLYKQFLDNRDTFPILKNPAVLEEAKQIKQVFLSNFRKETPRILSDIPHLYTEEKGKELGDYLF